MSFFEFVFIFFIALGVIPNTKLVHYYKKLISIKNQSQKSRRVIGDESINEEWYWLKDEDSDE